jgi:serpin B
MRPKIELGKNVKGEYGLKKRWIGLGLVLALLPSCSGSGTVMTLEQRRQAAEQIDSRYVQAENGFGLKLHQMLTEQAKDGENPVLSPYSVATALAIAYTGSAGETAAEMAGTLGWTGMDVEDVVKANRQLRELLETNGGDVVFRTANSIWYRKGIPMKKPFLDGGKADFDAEIRAVDFSSRSAVDAINRWVDKRTNGKIDRMIEDPPGNDQIAVLLNAVYFNGAWEDPFPKGATREEPFTLTDGTTKTVPMMRQTGHYAYAENESWQAVRLPYGDGRLKMLVIVPKSPATLDDLHRQLWSDPSAWQTDFQSRNVDLKMPRFKTETDVRLVEALRRLGMEAAFDRDRGDFSNMADIKPLYISDVRHRTFVEVHEEGTEAAAATSIGIAGASAPANPVRMTVDQPFFFAIEDAQTKAWLFVGSILNP